MTLLQTGLLSKEHFMRHVCETVDHGYMIYGDVMCRI